MSKLFWPVIAGILFFWGCSSGPETTKKPAIIPLPVMVTEKSGEFTITGKTRIIYNPGDAQVAMVAEMMNERLSALTGRKLSTGELAGNENPSNSIVLKTDDGMEMNFGKEGYKLSVTKKGIEISAPFPAGLFYGIQTIYQLLPEEVFSSEKQDEKTGATLSVPCLEIADYPSFEWRGMHLDVSRHFFPKEFVKKYIDLIAMHKMNVFHWHLTDDNGWRIEIGQYPRLTSVAAWRADRTGIPWTERLPQRPGEPATYGGFYTKEDIREIVEYARQRFITVVPEIEMPGHTSEVFAAYPEFSCTGERTTVQTGSYWPNTDIFCAGKDETFRFITNILDEVIELFPSEYIHIGGDEADKTAWKKCRECQARIRTEGLKDVDELQSYFIKRIERHLISSGRKLIGWDEILEGGLAPDAAVMSWRGFEGGIAAAQMGHKVVMCPTSYCYFDYYQGDPEYQPAAIGGLTTLRKVYSFNPVPEELQGEQRKLVLGGQGNLWTEYVPDAAHAEYMVLPRMTALAEVLWSPEALRNWDDFRERLQSQFARFRAMNANYSSGSGRVTASAVFNQHDKPYSIRLETEPAGAEIYYTLDGTQPGKQSFKYSAPVGLSHDVKLRTVAFKDEKQLERFVEYKIDYHELVGRNVSYQIPYSNRYPAGGTSALVDGLRAGTNYNDGYWQGFYGQNMDVVIALGEERPVSGISSTYLLDQKKWIFIPDVVNYYVSKDGQNFQKIAAVSHEIALDNDKALTNDFSIKLSKPLNVSYLRVEAVNIGECPDWHPGKGQPAWIFVDEIMLNE